VRPLRAMPLPNKSSADPAKPEQRGTRFHRGFGFRRQLGIRSTLSRLADRIGLREFPVAGQLVAGQLVAGHSEEGFSARQIEGLGIDWLIGRHRGAANEVGEGPFGPGWSRFHQSPHMELSNFWIQKLTDRILGVHCKRSANLTRRHQRCGVRPMLSLPFPVW